MNDIQFKVGDYVISHTDFSRGNLLIIKEKDRRYDVWNNLYFMYFAESPTGDDGEYLFDGDMTHAKHWQIQREGLSAGQGDW